MAEKRTIEDRRLALQDELDEGKTAEERNVLGQFATPTRLAQDIVAHAANLLGKSESIQFLDPGIGTGSFYSALRAVVPARRMTAAEGYEIDAHYGLPARKLWARTKLKIHLEDFTAANPPASNTERFNLVVCNPPYVRHHHILNGEKVRLQHASEEACGVRIAGLAGLYCYFLALSHPWMRDGGIAAWLIPSEFMDVNYGNAVKRYLLGQVHLLRIHRFDPNDVQFGDALVSSAIVFFRKEAPPKSHAVEFTFGGTIAKPELSRTVPTGVLQTEPKWTRFPVSDIREKHDGLVLGDLFKIKRGLATGNNQFFILTYEQIEGHELPWKFCIPILPSPRYLPSDHIKSDAKGNPILEKRLFLLDCRLPEDEVKERYPKLWKYLLIGRPDVSDRYLCRHRKPWYRQEDRPATPFICTYLGRSDKKNGRPFRFILNESQATAANVYLLLYPKPILANALARTPSLANKVWEFLNSISPEHLLDEGRVYGGGLHKLEPKELANVPADKILELAHIQIERPAKQEDLFAQQVA